MQQKIQQYILEKQLFDIKKDNILLAVSGGIDSMVLAHLFLEIGVNFGIAHCNFKLRGADSDEDEMFVKNFAESHSIPYHSIAFNTLTIATQNNESIQITARKLRYDWFTKIRDKFNYQWIATAHHSDDTTETILYNLAKGCGIKGLHGILPKRGGIIRPLLFATKQTLITYAQNSNISFREDSSNSSSKYARNAIRHQVIPVLKEINPSLEQTMQHNVQRFRETENLYLKAIDWLKKEVILKHKDYFSINIQKLIECEAPLSLLYEILHPLGFGIHEVEHILQNHKQDSGAMYYSKTHQVLKDRETWQVRMIEAEYPEWHIIPHFTTNGKLDLGNTTLTWEYQSVTPLNLKLPSSFATLDSDKLEYPLQIRKWQKGDSMQPLGMQGKTKKVSKIFKDQKISQFDKENTWIMCDAQNRIIWVIGLRIDERFSITSGTNKLIQFHIK